MRGREVDNIGRLEKAGVAVMRLAADQGEVGVFLKWNISPALPVQKK